MEPRKWPLRARLRWAMWRIRQRIAVSLADWIYGENMMWDADDPDRPYDSVHEWAVDVWGPTSGGQVSTVTMQRALQLPNRTYRIESYEPDPENSDYIEFRISRVRAKKEGGE